MNVIQTMTLRQMRAERTRTGLALLEITIASGLLSAVLMGGLSLVNMAYPDTPSLLAAYRQSPFVQLMLNATLVVAVLLLLATSFLIRSAFSVSLSQRVRALGQLASAGATRRQLRASVYWEALLLGTIAIPLGIVCAALGLWVTFSALNHVQAVTQILEEVGPSMKTLRLSVSPLGLLFCALWSAAMLFLSARSPVRAAFRVEPVETFFPARRTHRTK